MKWKEKIRRIVRGTPYQGSADHQMDRLHTGAMMLDMKRSSGGGMAE